MGWKSDIMRFNEFLVWFLVYYVFFKIIDFIFEMIYFFNNFMDLKGILGGVWGLII